MKYDNSGKFEHKIIMTQGHYVLRTDVDILDWSGRFLIIETQKGTSCLLNGDHIIRIETTIIKKEKDDIMLSGLYGR